MKINGWDISMEGAKQFAVTFGFSQITNNSEWPRGSPVPVMAKGEIGFKPIKITIAIKQNGREPILTACSRILAKLIHPAEIQLDGYSHRFYGYLKSHSFEENPMGRINVTKNKISLLTIEIGAYEFATQENGEPYKTSGSGGNLTVINPGNIVTPAALIITPQISMASLTIQGASRDRVTGAGLPIKIGNLQTGKTIKVDGEKGLITENGTLKKDITIWEMPTLLPGENTITLDSNRINLDVTYLPRFA